MLEKRGLWMLGVGFMATALIIAVAIAGIAPVTSTDLTIAKKDAAVGDAQMVDVAQTAGQESVCMTAALDHGQKEVCGTTAALLIGEASDVGIRPATTSWITPLAGIVAAATEIDTLGPQSAIARDVHRYAIVAAANNDAMKPISARKAHVLIA